jgi:hypothetical protein
MRTFSFPLHQVSYSETLQHSNGDQTHVVVTGHAYSRVVNLDQFQGRVSVHCSFNSIELQNHDPSTADLSALTEGALVVGSLSSWDCSTSPFYYRVLRPPIPTQDGRTLTVPAERISFADCFHNTKLSFMHLPSAQADPLPPRYRRESQASNGSVSFAYQSPTATLGSNGVVQMLTWENTSIACRNCSHILGQPSVFCSWWLNRHTSNV